MAGGYQFQDVQDSVREFWAEKKIYEQAKALSQKNKEKFYFLDGPPYTSGKVHIGTAWNKALKDLVLRYKRMRGFHVWDRAGYDMHGLPTEHATEKELGISGREAVEKFGVQKFIDACRELCVTNLLEMNKVFKDLGVWMDFENAYQTISREWIEGEWWLIKQAHEKERLYEGERAMTWDAHSATALAKHELVYEQVEDKAIYVKFKATDSDDWFVIWTTTPWTIPYNLAMMANPEVTYARVKVAWKGKKETWVVAKDLVDDFFRKKLNVEHEIIEEFQGEELIGKGYTHIFADTIPHYAQLKEGMPNVHTILMSTEYVDTSTGTGLVHCAPGCGPEDYEVGYRNGVKPFNTLDQHGYVRELPGFEGLRAKDEDDKFIEKIDSTGNLLFTHDYVHEYPFGERSKKPVIFRTTKQWFLKVEDIKDEMIKENNQIKWQPKAAYNAFNSWLENLRDNSISRQRFWGTPLPVWRNETDPDDFIVVGSAKELAELANLKELPEDLHIPTVDPIIIEKDGKKYRRVPDVLDVWVDAGTASWSCLDFPHTEEFFKEWFPSSFILEGKDQIRGWFNLLHVASMVSMDKPAFKAVYMHGFVNDSQGRKMSKSVGNYILPEEVTEKYGVDATRYYMIGAANPGYDMNYNFDDLEVKFRNLVVYWNTHKFLIELSAVNGISPKPILDIKDKLGTEEKYILSKLQTAIKNMTKDMDDYKLNTVPNYPEDFLLELSRTYIQLVRDKSTGTDEEKLVVVSTLAHCMLQGLTLLAPIVPFITEQAYQNIKAVFPELCQEQSVHFKPWPQPDKDFQNRELEKDFQVGKDVITAILSARDKAQIGTRWPIAEAKIECNEELRVPIEHMNELIIHQTNIKKITFGKAPLEYEWKLDFGKLGREFGEKTAEVIEIANKNKEKIDLMLKEEKSSVEIQGYEINEEHLKVSRTAVEPFIFAEVPNLRVFLDTTRTPELEAEGFAREVVRRTQQLRKKAGLVKTDRIVLELAGDTKELETYKELILDRTGAKSLVFIDSLSSTNTTLDEGIIKDRKILIGFFMDD